MLSRFSWQQYWCFIAIVTLLYYAAIALLYYRNEILSVITGKEGSLALDRETNENFPQTEQSRDMLVEQEQESFIENDHQNSSEETNEEQADEIDEEVNEKNLQLIERISEAVSVVMSAHQENETKEELLENIGNAVAGIAEYHELKEFREALDWHIERQASLICGLALLPNDIRRIWEIIQS